MNMHLRQRAVLMLFSIFLLLGSLSSCSNTASNIKKLDEAFSAGDYTRTMELATQYLSQDIQSGYFLYKGVAASFLGLPEEASRSLELYLAIAPESDEGRPLALRTMLDAAVQSGSLRQVVSVANELESLGQGTLDSRMELYKALIALGSQEQASVVLNDLLAPVLAPKSLCLLAVEAKADTSLMAFSLESWFQELEGTDRPLYLATYVAAVETARSRYDGAALLPVAKTVYDSGIYADDREASLVALCLGDVYAASGQKVLARRFWNEAVRYDGNRTAQERLATL